MMKTVSESGTAAAEIVAVVLAAGRGTRMGKLTETVPKPLIPVGGRPALFRVIDALVTSGIKRFVVVTGYKSGMVRDALAEYQPRAVEISFVHQAEQLGTAHAMKLTRELVHGAPVLLAFADIMTSAENYAALTSRFLKENCQLTAGVRDAGDPYRAAAVYLDSKFNITEIIEKPEKGTSSTPWSHAGMYCFSNGIYDKIDQVQPSRRGEFEVTDAVHMMIKEGSRCRAVELTGYWKDLATPEDITEAEMLIKADEPQPVATT